MPTTSLYYCKLFPIFTSLHAFITMNTGLSTLPDDPGESRFWTVSPGVQIRVWNLPDDRRSLPFLVDSTFWQLNFKYFALFELLLISNVSSQTPLCHCNASNNVRKPRRVFRPPTSDFRLPTSDLRLYTSNFRLQTWQSLNSGFSDFWPLKHEQTMFITITAFISGGGEGGGGVRLPYERGGDVRRNFEYP